MASFDPQGFGLDDPPPRPTTPPIRRGFLFVLIILCLLATLVYGIPYMAERAGYAWETGRSRAASEALKKLDEAGVVNRASALFRMASVAVAPAVVRVDAQRFQGVIGAQGNGGRRVGMSLGSGVIIDKDRGFIVTNNHVIKDADLVEVRLGAGTTYSASVVGTDEKTDLAVLRMNGTAPVAAQWGDSDKLDIGDWVLAIGSPFALDHTVTAGIVSATQRNDLRINEYESFIQTDAAINPGNSGGPLIDLSGKVVGINSAIYTSEQDRNGPGGNEGIGLAIPSAMAKRIVDSLIKDGKVVRGYLGVEMQPVNDAIAKQLGLPSGPQGALIRNVKGGSPAEKAGLKTGDVIVKVNNKDVSSPDTLRNETAFLTVGARVPVTYYREGKARTVDITIEEFPGLPKLLASDIDVREVAVPGPDKAARVLEIDRVAPGSPAFRFGLRPGMRLFGVGKTPVHTKAEFDAAVAALDPAKGLLLVLLTPEGQTLPITIPGR
jgi:serine protease Do